MFAKEHDALEQWEKMLGLAAAVAGDASMRAYLDQPELDDATKASAFAEVCGDELDESVRNFVAQTDAKTSVCRFCQSSCNCSTSFWPNSSSSPMWR